MNPSCLFQGLIFSYNKSDLLPKGVFDLTANAQRPISTSAVWLRVSMRSESDHETNALHLTQFADGVVKGEVVMVNAESVPAVFGVEATRGIRKR